MDDKLNTIEIDLEIVVAIMQYAKRLIDKKYHSDEEKFVMYGKIG